MHTLCMPMCVCRGDADVFTVNADFKSKFTKIKVKTVTAAKETAEEAQKTRSKVDDDRKPLVSPYCCLYILSGAQYKLCGVGVMQVERGARFRSQAREMLCSSSIRCLGGTMRGELEVDHCRVPDSSQFYFLWSHE